MVTMLQGVAAMRNWVVEHVPLAGSLLGYDLFIKLGNDLMAGLPLEVTGFAAGLPYPSEQVLAQLAAMRDAGLLALVATEGGRALIAPTRRFVGLLEEYSERFERLFIVRDDLRRRQLLVASSDPERAAFAELVFDRMHDLGWLYLYNYGAACFLVASLVRRIALAHGHQARVASCYVEIASDKGSYLLGAQGYAKPGQVDGHAVCIVDEALLVDFGLGNVRRSYRRGFPWGLACDAGRDGAVLAGLALPGEQVRWKDDWQSPQTQAELDRYEPHLDGLLRQYQARFG